MNVIIVRECGVDFRLSAATFVLLIEIGRFDLDCPGVKSVYETQRLFWCDYPELSTLYVDGSWNMREVDMLISGLITGRKYRIANPRRERGLALI